LKLETRNLEEAMNDVFKKLNYKDQAEIYVLNAPESFQPAMDEMGEIAKVKTSLTGAKDASFLLAFVTKQAEVDKISRQASKALKGDALLWFAYPKGSSKKYKCEFNRDSGWSVTGEEGFEPVRQVAIDEDWSALRFRRPDYIKTMTRSSAMTKAGKEKIKQTKKK
jgi:hypothetical protein